MVDNLIKLMFLLVLSFLLVSCQQEKSNQALSESIDYIENISGLQFPADAKLLHREESDRGGSNTFIWRIIYAKTSFNIENYKTVRVPTKSAYESIRSSLKNIDVGLPFEFFLTYRWTNEDGEWYGNWLETSNGYYLNLQQIITDNNSNSSTDFSEKTNK